MNVKAEEQITLSVINEVATINRYYRLQASDLAAPEVPTTFPPEGWNETEPSFDGDDASTLYFVDCTLFSNNTFSYSEVSKSSTYEVAKDAAKTASNYLDFTEDGLAIGDMYEQTFLKLSDGVNETIVKAVEGNVIRILPPAVTSLVEYEYSETITHEDGSFEVNVQKVRWVPVYAGRDKPVWREIVVDGTYKYTFPANFEVYIMETPLNKNVLIHSEGIDIRQYKTVLASFREKLIEIGKTAADAVISFCNGKAKMYSNNDGHFVMESDLIDVNAISAADNDDECLLASSGMSSEAATPAQRSSGGVHTSSYTDPESITGNTQVHMEACVYDAAVEDDGSGSNVLANADFSVNAYAGMTDIYGYADEISFFANKSFEIQADTVLIDGNATIRWEENIGYDTEQSFEMRISGGTGTQGLSIVRDDKDGNRTFHSLFNHLGEFLPDIMSKIKALAPVNNLTSTSTTAPLAANQGKVLNERMIQDTTYLNCFYRMNGNAKEWWNPPMIDGVVYRTTKRHFGKPVYALSKNLGALPNATTKSYALGSSGDVFADVVHMSIEAFNSSNSRRYMFPFINTDGEIVGSFYFGGVRTFTINAKSDLSKYTGKLYIEYTLG